MQMEKTTRYKGKVKKSSVKSKNSANKTAKKKMCTDTLIQSVTNTTPMKFLSKSSSKIKSPIHLNALQEIAPELMPSDTIKIPASVVEKKEKDIIHSPSVQLLQSLQTTESLQSQQTQKSLQQQATQKQQSAQQQQSFPSLEQQLLQSQQTLQPLQHKPTQQKQSLQSTQQQEQLQSLELQQQTNVMESQPAHQQKLQQSTQEHQPVKLQQSLQSQITQQSLQLQQASQSLQHRPTQRRQSQQWTQRQQPLHLQKVQQRTQLLRQKSTPQDKPHQPKYKQKPQQPMQQKQSQSPIEDVGIKPNGFVMPKMPLVSSDVFKMATEKRNVIKKDVAINTGNDEEVAKELFQHVDTLRKISLISEDFSKKTVIHLKEIVHSVQDDFVKKLKEMQEQQLEQNAQEKSSIAE